MRVNNSKLDRAFNPHCIAVIGDSAKNGFTWLRAQSNFKGKVYSVQVDPASIEGIESMGIENYTSILDIPEPVDLVIVSVPRRAALTILEDCIRKEVAAVHFFTAGFAETGGDEGIELERLLTERAKQANLHLIGPNCMGIFNPRVGIKQNGVQYDGVSGPVGFISQSGTHAINFSLMAHLQGLDVSKSVSFGNGRVLDSPDFLEYFRHDPETKVIGMYLEGVRDGRRFFQVLKEVSSEKPVVLWKGGRTEEGGRAIASHTGSLATSREIWDAAVRQCGAIKVDRMEELIDTLKALYFLPPVHSDRVAVAGGSGGQSVAVADVFAEAGLRLPALTQESYDEFATFFSLIGGSYGNPIDTGNPNRQQMKHILEILESDANVDNLVLVLNYSYSSPEQLDSEINVAADIRKRNSKSILGIVPFSTPREMSEAMGLTQRLQHVGIPAFPSMERGAFALRKVMDYYSRKGAAGS